MRTVYIADDGKEFDDEYECEHYEWKLKHPNLTFVTLFDKDKNVLNDIFSEDTYGSVMTIVVLNDDAAKELRDFVDYAGYCAYQDIEEAGVWVWNEHRFVKE